MKTRNASYVASATTPAQYPKTLYPEVAFAGRSNVGKSSLINALLQMRGLAKISSTPGKTRTINFFLVDERIMFVDLPGYGYAKVPQSLRAGWGPMIETYLKARKNLAAVVHIADLRLEPQPLDFYLAEWLSMHGIRRIVAATKADKLSRGRSAGNLAVLKEGLKIGPEEEIIAFSAKTGQGRNEVWRKIEAFCSELKAKR